MGITVRVKLKMSWVIITFMFILVFINTAFIINEIIKGIMNTRKKPTQERDMDPGIQGTEGDEAQLKNPMHGTPPLGMDEGNDLKKKKTMKKGKQKKSVNKAGKTSKKI